MKKLNQLLGLSIALIVWVGLGLSSVSAQGNPIPLNWRNMTVQVFEGKMSNPLKGPLQLDPKPFHILEETIKANLP